MADSKDKRKKTEFGENPFLGLNKKAFPEQKNKNKSSVPAAPAPMSQSPDAEHALFLQALQGVSPLAASRQVAVSDDKAEGWERLVAEMKTPAMPQKKRRKHLPAVPQNQLDRKEEDQAVQDFAAAMRDVQPLRGKGREIPAEPEPTPSPTIEENNELHDFLKGKLEFAFQHTDEYVAAHVVGLDLITVGKLQAGQFSPEAHLDLHGLNALQAYQRLVGFMRNAYMRNQRTVLLVPGRGLNSPNGMSVLREKVQTWLTQEPFRRVVLAFCTAQPADGGAGALYVLLRKFRKDQGKVYWDRVPVDPDLLMD